MIPPTTPVHSFEMFREACEAGRVVVTKSALDTVEQLGISPDSDSVIAWICAGGVVAPQHWNTEPWKNNPDPSWKQRKLSSNVVWVDAFIFTLGPEEEGYIAYLYSPMTQKWILKSLKPNY